MGCIKMIEGENKEYKESFGDAVLKTLCGFANTSGGEVIIGISDKGEVKGIKITNEELEKITGKIVGKLGIHPEITIENYKGKEVLKIRVQKSNVPISFNGRYYERVGNTTREMEPEKLKEFFLKEVNWDSIVNESADFNEIDKETVRRFIRMAKNKGRLTMFDEDTDIKTLFEHLKLSIDGKLTNGAIILFGKNPQKYFLNAVLRVARLKNEITIIGDRLIEGNLFQQVFEGEEAIKNFINVRYEIKELVRREIWDYPLEAIREALINSLIHRDYFKWNVQTQIKIFDDYIWFFNIGGLPEGITLEQLKKPHPSVPRNPLIVHVFYLAGLIEEVGSGIGRIMESIKHAELPEPEFKEGMGGFSVYFRKDIYTEEHLRNLGLTERQIKAVFYVKEKGKITNKEYQELNGVSKPTATRELKEIEEKEIFEKVGITGKGTFYCLKGSQWAQRAQKGLTMGSNERWTINYYCEDVNPKIKELLEKINKKHGIGFEIIQNTPWDEKKDKEIYEKYFKSRSRILKKRTGKSITELRSKGAGHYFVSIPGTIAIFKNDILEYWEFATDEGIKFLEKFLEKGGL